MEFIETSIFTKQIDSIATDEDITKLQVDLIQQPEKGDLIQGTGGFRKVRMALAGKGKSGGVRVIYYYIRHTKIYLVMAYPKSKQDNLSAAEKKQLKQLAKQLDGE
ncbi:MAG: type II toxin-antitoxin system RelE/ParE family toxin [Hydrogenovibrio sp.]